MTPLHLPRLLQPLPVVVRYASRAAGRKMRGSWVVISGVISRVIIIVTHIRGLMTPLITAHEPMKPHTPKTANPPETFNRKTQDEDVRVCRALEGPPLSFCAVLRLFLLSHSTCPISAGEKPNPRQVYSISCWQGLGLRAANKQTKKYTRHGHLSSFWRVPEV